MEKWANGLQERELIFTFRKTKIFKLLINKAF